MQLSTLEFCQDAVVCTLSPEKKGCGMYNQYKPLKTHGF